MTAASVLVERCRNNDVSRFDLVYPILFNYRHGLKAAIKRVLDRYGRYTAIETYDKDHNLHKLWKVCRQVIEEVGGQGGDDEALNTVEKIVHAHVTAQAAVPASLGHRSPHHDAALAQDGGNARRAAVELAVEGRLRPAALVQHLADRNATGGSQAQVARQRRKRIINQ